MRLGIFPENQPVFFETYSENCQTSVDEMSTPVEQADVCQFQVKIQPCAGSNNVIVNSKFDTQIKSAIASEWIRYDFELGSNKAIKTADSSTGYLKQFGVFEPDSFYIVTVDIESISGTLYLMNGAATVGEINSAGVSYFSFRAVSPDLKLDVRDGSHAVTILEVSAREFSGDFGFGILDSADVVVAGYYTISGDPAYFVLSKDSITVKFKWSDLSLDAGCYRIGITTGCDIGVYNSDFEFLLNYSENGDSYAFASGWELDDVTSTGDYSFVRAVPPQSGESRGVKEGAFVNTGAFTFYQVINNRTTLIDGATYQVTMGDMLVGSSGYVRIYMGTAYHDFTASGEVANIVCSGGTTCTARIVNDDLAVSYLFGFDVDFASTSDYQTSYSSQLFGLKTTHDCSYLINASFDEDGAEMVFEGTQFAPSLRIIGELRNVKPRVDKKVYLDNRGNRKTYFAEMRKRKELSIDLIPAYHIEFLGLCLMCDHFFIDGVEYNILDDEVSTRYAPSVPDVSSTLLEVEIKEQFFRNTNSGNTLTPVLGNESTYLLGVPPYVPVDALIELSSGDFVKLL